jgi:hypothetical protein
MLYILHYPSRVHSQAVYSLTLPFHFSNYIPSLSIITSFLFLSLFYRYSIFADSVIQVQCLYLPAPLLVSLCAQLFMLYFLQFITLSDGLLHMHVDNPPMLGR